MPNQGDGGAVLTRRRVDYWDGRRNFCKSKYAVASGEADQQRDWADDRWNENQYCEPVTHGTSPKPRRSFASLETDMVGFDRE